ncbi:MAG TPA: DUF4395 family protein [Coriobacteriia bacterium]|nr:DUF4395 family protein [Coriobacteriia bacterium]
MDYAIIQRNAFIFCRYSIAALIWVALLLQNIWVLLAVFVILLASALLTVRRAPMIMLWTWTLGRVLPSEEDVLDIRAMRFAHGMGAMLALISLSLVWHNNPLAWWFVGLFAILKTTSALGWCPAYKIYGCLKEGGCCALTGKRSADVQPRAVDDPR